MHFLTLEELDQIAASHEFSVLSNGSVIESKNYMNSPHAGGIIQNFVISKKTQKLVPNSMELKINNGKSATITFSSSEVGVTKVSFTSRSRIANEDAKEFIQQIDELL